VPFGFVKATVIVSGGLGVGVAVGVAVGLAVVCVTAGDDEVSVLAVAVDPGVPARFDAGVCDDVPPGVANRFGVEVRDATSDCVRCVPMTREPMLCEVPGKATNSRPVMMPAMMTIL